MSRPCQQAVRKHLPKATPVFDRFHVVKLLNHELTQLRRQLYRQATSDLKKKVLKGTRSAFSEKPLYLGCERGQPAGEMEDFPRQAPAAGVIALVTGILAVSAACGG
jgi:hypothetical protein